MLRNTSRSSFIDLLLAENDVHGSDRHRVARELQAALSYEAKVAEAIVSEASRHLGPLLEPETSALLRKALAPMLERDLWDRARTLATLTTTVLEEIVRRARIVTSPAIGT